MFNIDSQVKSCLKNLSEKYDLSSLSIRQVIEFTLQWGEKDAIKHAADCYKLEEERKEKERQKEATREDYREVVGKDGFTWYYETHFDHQRPESRKLKKGDAIVYKAHRDEGIMIIKSFDFESDFAARSYIQGCSFKLENGNETPFDIYSDLAPGLSCFRFATEEEIDNLFLLAKSDYDFNRVYLTDLCPDYIKERYSKYLKDNTDEGNNIVQKYDTNTPADGTAQDTETA